MLSSEQKNIIKNVVSKIDPTFIGVFGSYARGEQTSSSDIDILIDFDSNLDLLQLIGLEQELTEKLGIKVDLVTKRSLNLFLKPFVERDLIPIV